jgi:hypothetical protein
MKSNSKGKKTKPTAKLKDLNSPKNPQGGTDQLLGTGAPAGGDGTGKISLISTSITRRTAN